jgi:hypothetical protein
MRLDDSEEGRPRQAERGAVRLRGLSGAERWAVRLVTSAVQAGEQRTPYRRAIESASPAVDAAQSLAFWALIVVVWAMVGG